MTIKLRSAEAEVDYELLKREMSEGLTEPMTNDQMMRELVDWYRASKLEQWKKTMAPKEQPEELPIISSYTSEEAAEDGILLDIVDINPAWEKGIIRYVTTTLLDEHGYMTEEGEVNNPNLLDLLNQANNIVRTQSNGFKDAKETLYTGSIELPSGKKLKVYVEMNELGKYTVMLPEDN